MDEEFGERVNLTESIKGILDSYVSDHTFSAALNPYHLLLSQTFGNGNLRELLQNSDDARATTQVCLCVYPVHVLSPELVTIDIRLGQAYLPGEKYRRSHADGSPRPRLIICQ